MPQLCEAKEMYLGFDGNLFPKIHTQMGFPGPFMENTTWEA